MSASERLERLAEEQRTYGWPGPPVRIVFDALPELIAVVKAAELVDECCETLIEEGFDYLAEPMRAELVAVRESLRRILRAVEGLTPLERRALVHVVNGRPYRDSKQIDNAALRARRKLRAAA